MSSYVSDKQIEENGDDDGISDAEKDIHDFEEHKLNHDIAFSHHKRLSFLSHTLQLVVRTFDTIRSPKRAVKKAHKVVKKVCKSTKATERLIGLCGVKLIADHDCPTRWNSTYLMIARLLKVRPSLTQVLQELGWDSLQNREWRQLESLHEILKPFACYTQLVSGEYITTISAVIPVLLELQCHLEEVSSLKVNKC